jgi:hypothetical protein
MKGTTNLENPSPRKRRTDGFFVVVIAVAALVMLAVACGGRLHR